MDKEWYNLVSAPYGNSERLNKYTTNSGGELKCAVRTKYEKNTSSYKPRARTAIGMDMKTSSNTVQPTARERQKERERSLKPPVFREDSVYGGAFLPGHP